MARKVAALEHHDGRPNIDSIHDLVEITGWLGTYRERLRLARHEDRQELAADVVRWTDRLKQRRAELS
jgi:hypothetical protein